jgi:PAS domain S-box-containing protein
MALTALAMTVAYFITAHLGLLLMAKPENIAVFWPASGLAAGALVLLGKSARLPVAIAVALATVTANAIDRGSPLAGVSFAFTNTVECLLFAWIIERFDRGGELLEDLRSVLVFLLGATFACAVAAVPASLALRLLGMSGAPLLDLWLTWFSSDAIGILAVAPVLLTVRAFWTQPPPPLIIAEACLALSLVFVAALYGYNPPRTMEQWQLLTPATLLFPLLLWIAGRTPAIFGALAALIVSIVIVVSALPGESWSISEAVPFTGRTAAARVRILTVVVCTLTLAAMFARLRNLVSALGKSDARLREALSAARMYAFDHDPATGKVHRIGSLIEHLDLPADGDVGDYTSLLHPEDRPIFEALFDSLSPESPELRHRFRMRSIDGSYLYIAHRALAEFDAQGNTTRRLGTCVDVTARQRIELALRESEELLRQSMAAGRVYAFEWDLEADAVKRSENAAEILGIPNTKLNMRRSEFKAYLPAEDRERVQFVNSQIAPEHPFNNFTMRFVRPDGKMIWLEVNERGAFDARGRLTRLSGITRDVTSRVLADKRQSELIDELNHRVMNTLATVRALVSLTRRDHADIDDYMRTLLGRLSAMEHTHNRLSDNAWDGVSMAELVCDELAPYATAGYTTWSGPEIKLIPAAALVVCLTLHELATNAAKYGALSDTGGSIEVSWRIESTADGGGRLKLDWIERVPKGIAKPQRESYGTRTIRNALPHEFQGTVKLNFTDRGLHCSIELPLDRIAEPHRLPELSLATASSAP